MSYADKVQVYIDIFQLALLIPFISILGVILGGFLKRRNIRILQKNGYDFQTAKQMLVGEDHTVTPNWWILFGSLAFVVFTLSIGLSSFDYREEIVFVGSMGIVLFLMLHIIRTLEPSQRSIFIGTALIIFVYRAMPTPGAGVTWWMIDVLGFDQQFLAVLSLIGSGLALGGMFLLRRFMAESSISYIFILLTIITALIQLPMIGMYYGLHEWTSSMTHGIVDARFIALVDTALESPFGQVAMIPMLAWIAHSSPTNYKATFFAIMASFANLALSLSQLGTKYMNQVFTITRSETDLSTGIIHVPANYGELGMLLVSVTLIGLVLPILTVWIVNTACSSVAKKLSKS